jgi:hypothetical protein
MRRVKQTRRNVNGLFLFWIVQAGRPILSFFKFFAGRFNHFNTEFCVLTLIFALKLRCFCVEVKCRCGYPLPLPTSDGKETIP